MNKDFFWSNYIAGIAFGSTMEDNSYKFLDGNHYAIFDTGSSHLLIPPSVYDLVIDKLVKVSGEPSYQIEDGFIITSCRASWKPLYLMISGYWIQILPEDYVYDVSENGDRSVCHLAILKNTLDYWLLGMPFYQGYYVIHNMGELQDNGTYMNPTVGFAPHVDSKKFPLQPSELPINFLKVVRNNLIEMYVPPIYLAICVLIFALLMYCWLNPSYGTSNWRFYAWSALYWIFCLLFFAFVVYPQMLKWSESVYGAKETDGA